MTDLTNNNKPQILCFDLSKDDVELLKQNKFNITSYSLTENYSFTDHSVDIVPKLYAISNSHEYEVAIFSLGYQNEYTEKVNGHKKPSNTGKYLVIHAEYPANTIDLKPYNIDIINMNKFKNDIIKIYFCGKAYSEEYNLIIRSDNSREDTRSYHNYAYTKVSTRNKCGNRILLVNDDDFFSNILKKYKDSFRYEVILEHEQVYNGTGWSDKYPYYDLLVNEENEVVATILDDDGGYELYLPETDRKAEILVDLLNNVFPRLKPTSFPYASNSLWKDAPKYWTPGRQQLENEKKEELKRHEHSIAKIDKQLEENQKVHKHLIDLLTASGDKLVDAVAQTLRDFGFKKVETEKDFLKPGDLKEEDIRTCENEIPILIECKGIGGTSTDNDCRQIGKIKLRRQKQLKSLDVIAIYIVNHQMYIEPEKRNNPPFQEIQIEDAKDEYRGLATTYDLFKQALAINNGYASLEETRKSLMEYGLVKFKLDKLTFLGKATELYKENFVVILNIKDIQVEKTSIIVIEYENQYIEAEIESLQVNDECVESVRSGEVGIKLNTKIKKGSNIYTKKDAVK